MSININTIVAIIIHISMTLYIILYIYYIVELLYIAQQAHLYTTQLESISVHRNLNIWEHLGLMASFLYQVSHIYPILTNLCLCFLPDIPEDLLCIGCGRKEKYQREDGSYFDYCRRSCSEQFHPKGK